MITVGITEFVLRQTSKNFKGTLITLDQLNKITDLAQIEMNVNNFKDGYAPFCKIVKLDNIFGLNCPIIEITKNNEHLLRSSYESRQPGELPVLVRYFPERCCLMKTMADNINVILYSKEQLAIENTITDFDWCVVCINAEFKTPAPMTPNTILRNHLGPDFGGSGKKINIDEYMESVKFWSNHAMME